MSYNYAQQGGYGQAAQPPPGGGGYPPPGGGYGAPPPGRPPTGGPPSGGGYGAPPPGAPPSGGGYGGPPPPGGGYGGQAQGQGRYGGGPPPPPPGADPQLWTWFSAVDLDRSGHITVSELERALINGDWSPFDIDTVKLLMTIFDTDRSGTIGFNEFSGLWKYIKDWQNIFRHFDKDRSGTIEGEELRTAMAQFGYNLSPALLTLVEKKYAAGVTGTQVSGGGPGITFDRFVRACVVVKQLTEAFQRLDNDRDGWVQIDYNGFMQTVLSLP